MRLVAQTPEGCTSSQEALVVVALRGDRRLDALVPASGDTFRAVEARGVGQLLSDLLAPLADLPPDEWTFDQVVYEVVDR